MADYIIENAAKFSVGLRKFNGVAVNIAPGKRVSLSEDDILNESRAMSRWLGDGVLKCADPKVYELLGITTENAVVSMTDEEIQQKFKQPMKGFAKWLEEQDSSYVLNRIVEAAIAYDDLPQKKLELIEKKTGAHISEMRRLNKAKEE